MAEKIRNKIIYGLIFLGLIAVTVSLVSPGVKTCVNFTGGNSFCYEKLIALANLVPLEKQYKFAVKNEGNKEQKTVFALESRSPIRNVEFFNLTTQENLDIQSIESKNDNRYVLYSVLVQPGTEIRASAATVDTVSFSAFDKNSTEVTSVSSEFVMTGSILGAFRY